MINVHVTSRVLRQNLTHSWRTSIQETIKGGEKRSSLVTWPKVRLESELQFFSSYERRFIHSHLQYRICGTWGCPFVFDRTLITGKAVAGQKVLKLEETVYRHFYDKRGLILVDPTNWENHEYAVIDTVDSNTQITMLTNLVSTWPVGTYVYPMYEFRISEVHEVQIPFWHLNVLRLAAIEKFEDSISFVYNVPSSGAPIYKGLDLFLTKPVYSTKEQYKHPFEALGSIGLSYISTSYDQAKLSFLLDFVLSSREDAWNILQFFDSKRGRFQAFRMPSWNNDIVVTSAIAATDTVLTIEEMYLTDSEIVGKDLYIRLPNGIYACKEIVDRPSSAQIQLDSAIGRAVPYHELQNMLLSFLLEVRFDVDEILFKYITSEIVRTKLRFRSIL